MFKMKRQRISTCNGDSTQHLLDITLLIYFAVHVSENSNGNPFVNVLDKHTYLRGKCAHCN